jgi:hypothetical protein
MFGAPVHFVRLPQLRLQVAYLVLEGLMLLLVSLQGGVGLGAEVCAVRLEALGALSLGLLLQAYPPLVEHVVHPLLEGGLSVLQRLLVLDQVGGGLAHHILLGFEGFPLPVEPVLDGGGPLPPLWRALPRAGAGSLLGS